jgi:hypothetical protein
MWAKDGLMVLGFGRGLFGKKVALPWGSVDPREGETPTNWEGESKGQWTLEAPAGEWRMEGQSALMASAADQKNQDEKEEEDLANKGQQDGHLGAFDLEDEELATGAVVVPEDVGEEEAYPPREAADSGAWTITILCAGLGLIAACLIIPQADANRRLVYEREQLRLDLQQVQKQASVNKEFLNKMEIDPQLTERLAQREMRAVEQGEAVVNVGDNGSQSAQNAASAANRMSRFALVNVPPPPKLEAYQPTGGSFAELCRNPSTHVYVLGMGMIMVAGGLVLGGGGKRDVSASA